MQTLTAVLVVMALGLLSSCAPISKQQKALLEKQIDCSDWKADIAALEKEKASAMKQIISGARSIAPTAAAANILLGYYKDGMKVASGRYNRMIAEKISQIRKECGEQVWR